MPNRKKVAIIMGSDSDWPVVKSACGGLKDFDVPFEAHILSAHRTPEAAAAFAKVQKAPGTAARQHQRRRQHKRRPSFFMHHFHPRSILYSNLHDTPCTEDSEDSISYSAAECESKCVKICCTISVRKSILTSRQKNATLYADRTGRYTKARLMTRYRRHDLCLTKSRTRIPRTRNISPT